jgi:uncharacterized protein YuzE
MKDIIYFFKEDVAYISLCDEKSMIGDEDFQEGVVLYKNNSNDIIGIEILNFTTFQENKIQLAENKFLDFTKTFKELHILISFRDIIDDPEQFLATCKEWGINVEVINNKLHSSTSINMSIPHKDISQLATTNC